MQVEPGALLEAPGEVQQLQTLHTLQAGDLMPLTNGVHHAGSELDGLEEGSDAGAGAREERVVVSPLGCWVGWEGRWALPAPAGTGSPRTSPARPLQPTPRPPHRCHGSGSPGPATGASGRLQGRPPTGHQAPVPAGRPRRATPW